jgi:lipopolysaccharide export system permease protein
MRANGMHLFTITRSLWAGGVLLALAMLYLNGDLIPRSVEMQRTMRDNWRFSMQEKTLQDKDQVGLVYALGYHNQKDRRLWFMNRYSQRSNEGFGINVYVMDAHGQEVYRVIAKDGYYDETVGYWYMNNGREVFFDPEQGGAYRAPTFEHKAFPAFTEKPVLMLTLAKELEDLSLLEIRSLLTQITPEENPRMYAYAVRYQNILALPFTCLVVMGIAIPFAVSGVRTNPMIGVSKAVGLFVAYYVVVNVLRLMGEQQVVSPFLAAWIPIVLMFGVSVYFFRKVA